MKRAAPLLVTLKESGECGKPSSRMVRVVVVEVRYWGKIAIEAEVAGVLDVRELALKASLEIMMLFSSAMERSCC
jgi:hypothetical protein